MQDKFTEEEQQHIVSIMADNFLYNAISKLAKDLGEEEREVFRIILNKKADTMEEKVIELTKATAKIEVYDKLSNLIERWRETAIKQSTKEEEK